jgi:hypothetical protein
MQYLSALTVLAVSVTSAAARQMTVYNNCPFTIWPAVCLNRRWSPERRLTARIDVHGLERRQGRTITNHRLAAERVPVCVVHCAEQLAGGSHLGTLASFAPSVTRQRTDLLIGPPQLQLLEQQRPQRVPRRRLQRRARLRPAHGHGRPARIARRVHALRRGWTRLLRRLARGRL